MERTKESMKRNGARLRLTDDLFLRHALAIQKILARAVHEALLQHKQAGNRVAAWKNGRVVLVPPKEIPVRIVRGKSRT